MRAREIEREGEKDILRPHYSNYCLHDSQRIWFSAIMNFRNFNQSHVNTILFIGDKSDTHTHMNQNKPNNNSSTSNNKIPWTFFSCCSVLLFRTQMYCNRSKIWNSPISRFYPFYGWINTKKMFFWDVRWCDCVNRCTVYFPCTFARYISNAISDRDEIFRGF